MRTTLIASVSALVGAVAWAVDAATSWGSDSTHGPAYIVGLVALGIALAGAGYALVATAPVWLRAVVSVATLLLGLMIWLLVPATLSPESLAMALGAAGMLVGGLVGLSRLRGGRSRADRQDPAPVRGRRAAR